MKLKVAFAAFIVSALIACSTIGGAGLSASETAYTALADRYAVAQKSISAQRASCTVTLCVFTDARFAHYKLIEADVLVRNAEVQADYASWTAAQKQPATYTTDYNALTADVVAAEALAAGGN